MNRREFLQSSGALGCVAFLLARFKWVKASTPQALPEFGLPACFPFCLAPSPNLRKQHTVFTPIVSRQTAHGGHVVQTTPRRNFIKFWERYD